MGTFSEHDLPTALQMTRAVFLYGISRRRVRDAASLARFVKAIEDAGVPILIQWSGDGNEALRELQEAGLIRGYPATLGLTPEGVALVKKFEKALSTKLDAVTRRKTSGPTPPPPSR